MGSRWAFISMMEQPWQHDPGTSRVNMSSSPESLLKRTLRGDTLARERLAMAMLPVIQNRASRAALRHAPARIRGSIRAEIEDLVQEICLLLFVEDCRVLRAWDESRGVSLEGFVGVVAQKRTISLLRSRRHLPVREEFAMDERFFELRAVLGFEQQAVDRDLLEKVFARVSRGLKPEGKRVLEMLFVQGCSIADVEQATGRSAAALYKQKSRLNQALRLEFEKLTAEGGEDDESR